MRRCCCCCFMYGTVTADVSQSEMESKQNRRTGLTPQNKMYTFTFGIWSKQCWKFDGSTHARTHFIARIYTKQRLCTIDDFPFAAHTISKRMHSTFRCIRARYNCDEEWVKHRKHKKRKKNETILTDIFALKLFHFSAFVGVCVYGFMTVFFPVCTRQFAKKQTNTEIMEKHHKFNSFRQFSHFVCWCCCCCRHRRHCCCFPFRKVVSIFQHKIYKWVERYHLYVLYVNALCCMLSHSMWNNQCG